ncbi:peptidase [Hoyosella rhizosphaerae]|uniref:Peptidase n=1 Tax=Hoyosella rhizosphaerae TaxID=1755582 RepID=A0A916XCT7_9ACTN|nr:peptidase [Hoyosella rhizosphaerae]MBN4927432.1 peptidase [Hoyosella rhizosphaerae]GGC64460.1 hypothetical protein GCM10011410_16230 [Hoyosella rhizosphaerae]
MYRESVELSPFEQNGTLRGFMLSGRWPESTTEWAQLLILAVRIASLPGLLPTTTVFDAREDHPNSLVPNAVGLLLAAGTILGDEALNPGAFANECPPALLMLHPPSETRPTLPECASAASGCLLLPGIPHLGLDHRASWVEADLDGTVTNLVSKVGIDPNEDPDTAVLAMLLAA